MAVLVLAVALALIVGRRVVRPIEALARAARAVRKGRVDEIGPLPRSRIYELDEANRSFGEMLEGLRERNLIRETLGQFVPEQVARELLAAVGSAGRLSYTVHGNAVNLAARLEQMNKEYGTRILLSDKTAERCPGFNLRKLAEAEIRGYSEPVSLYTPV